MSVVPATRHNRYNSNSVTDVPDVTGDGERIPFLPWAEFDQRFEWNQGEHLAAIAATQSGKTTLIKAIILRRAFCVMLATKNKDRVFTSILADGFRLQKRWEPVPLAYPRIMLKPGLKSADHMWEQRAAFKECLDNVFQSGGWTVWANEVRYITKNLHLEREMQLLWLQASSADATIVGETQRPAWVPQEMYNASTHLFFWSENDERNLKRISELDGANTDLIRWQVRRLREYETLYVCTRKRAQGLQMARTIAPKGR